MCFVILPNDWTTDGPFGIWNHPYGYTIVNTEPQYVLSRNFDHKVLGTFDDLETAMLSPLIEPTTWMGNVVLACPRCHVVVVNVDDCGEFGNPDCPRFGINRKKEVQ